MKSIAKQKGYYIFLFILFNFNDITAQNTKIDSLLFVNQKLKDSDTNKVINVLEIVREYRKKQDNVTALKYAKEAEHLLPKSNSQFLAAKTNYILGVIYYNNTQYKEALSYIIKALKLYETKNEKNNTANCYNVIALIYQDQTFYMQAQEYHLKCLKIREEISDSINLGGSYSNIGLNFSEIAKHKNENFNESQNIKDAIYYLKKAYEHGTKHNNFQIQANSLGNLSNIMNDLKKYNEAINYAQLALKIYQKSGNFYQEAISLIDIGSIYLAQKRYKEAIPYFEKSLKYGLENSDNVIQQYCYKNLVSCYEKTGDFTKAFKNQTKLMAVKDSLFNSENLQQINDMQAKYESEKKEKEIESLSKEKLLQEVEINKKKNELNTQKNIRNYSFMGLGILALSFLLLYLNYSTKKKSAKILEEKNKEIETKNKDITDSIQYASRIQNAILPSLNDIKKTFSNSFVLYKPKDIVAGDFYWMETISSIEGGLKVSDNHPSSSPQGENLVIIAAADCTGHGVPGAMVSVVCSNALNRAVKEYQITEPAKILDKTRELVIEHFSKNDSEVKDGMDISLCKIELSDSGKYSIEWAGANNSLWICRPCNSDSENKINASSVVSNNNFDLFEIAANKQPIGNFINKTPFTNHLIELQKGDSIFLFTDGFADQFGGEKGKKLKSSNFKKLLLSIQHENMNKQLQMLNDAFDKWKGNFEQVDDVCVIGIKIT
jgi:serine phosphatase RsbU (regulator of sigma subunit)